MGTKNAYILTLVLLVSGLSSRIWSQTYCAAQNTDCNFEYITNVNLSNLNNTTDCGLPYDDFTALTAEIAPGSTTNGTISKSDILTNYIAVVFIDWNTNGIFEPTEQITTNLQGTSVFTFTVTTPIGVTVGPKRMRVRMGQNTVPAACGSLGRGDTEDYTVVVTPPPFTAPVNDLCANATVLTPTSTCSNTGGTTIGSSPSAPPNACGAGSAANDVWYSFTANGTAEYEIYATGTGAGANIFDPVIEFYSSCNAADYISCQNATLGNMTEVLATGFLPAGTYYYRIYGAGNNGNFTTCVVDITPQPGDDCDNPLNLTAVSDTCSAEQRYNNFGAVNSSYGPTGCWTNTSKDVWFSFTAIAENVRIDVFGLGAGTNTLQQPQINLYSGACLAVLVTEGCATTTPGTNNSFLSVGGLTVGTEYLIRIDSQIGHEGTFQFCIDNFVPPVLPGQDCPTARVLCTKNSITETDITGFGADGAEAAGSCLAGGVSPGLNTEQNSTWYTWTAADNGTIGFDIIPGPTTPNLDIDFVLFQLDPVTGCTGRTMIRCMGSSCVGPTGLNATSIDVTEPFDCDPTIQDNYLMQLTQNPGTRYGLLVNNFQNGGSGYTINFNGTGNFLGPQPGFTIATANPCVLPQTITVTDTSIDVTTYSWNFGADANPPTANTAGPHNVTYSTAGTKTITLTVTGAGGCDSTIQKQYTVAAPINFTTSINNAVCDLNNGSITVNSTGGNGLPAQFDYQLDGGTVQNNNQFNNVSPGNHSITVTDTSGCSITQNVNVGNTPTPQINPIAPVVICDEYLLPAIAGSNLTGSESYYSGPNGSGTNYAPGQLITNSMTLYAYDATNTVPVCSDEESFTITINEAPGFTNLSENCNMTDYNVSFTVTGGDPGTYAVNVIAPAGVTGTFSGNTWTSTDIASGVTYQFEITDGNGCTPTVVSGVQNCNCSTNAGTMNTTPITLCGTGPITAIHNNGTVVNDGNDALQFVLHTSNGGTLGTVLATSNNPTFSFIPGTTNYATFYYISAISGDDLGGNQVDINDPCLDVAAGTPVRWRQAPTADISGNASICNGQSTPLNFTFTGVAPFSVTYNNGTANQTLSNLGASASQNVSPTVTRNYTLVSVNSSNGCAGTVAPTVVTVTVNNPPTVGTITYNCNANSDAYSVSFPVSDGNGGPYSVNVVDPAGLTGGGFMGNTYTSGFIPSGQNYTFEVDDANGCGPVILTGSHVCPCLSNAGLMSQTPQMLCDNQAASPTHNQSAMVQDGNDVLNYILHDQSGTTLGNILGNQNNPNFTPQPGVVNGTTYYISAVVGNNNGSGQVDLNDPCLSVASGTPVQWNATPTTTAGALANPICAGDPLNLTATNSANSTFSWTHSNSGYTSNQQNPERNPSTTGMSGTYTVTVTRNTCSSTSTVNITVNPVPNTTISANPADPFCENGGVVQLTAASAGGTWSGNGITNPSNGTFNPAVAGDGTHTITYSVGGNCPSSSTRDITVTPTPDASFIADFESGCSPLTVQFMPNDMTNQTYDWAFGNGTGVSTDLSPSITYPAGVYTVSLTVEKDNCQNTVQLVDYIEVFQTPTAAYTFNELGAEGAVLFNNLSQFASQYAWDFGDGGISNEEAPTHNFQTEGPHTVILTAIGDGGCQDVFASTFSINLGQLIYIPNTFSPDGDPVNQVFTPILSGDIDVSTYAFEVFNRWGEKVFESKDINIGWDGTYKNKLSPNGIYSYKIVFKALNSDERIERRGLINLIR